jgi:hypothetical protein
MNLNEFIGYIKSPELLGQEEVPAIKDLIKEFPYCQSLHLLYLKNLHNTKSVYYDNYLRIAAAYATDRERLYWLINGSLVHSFTGSLEEDKDNKDDDELQLDIKVPITELSGLTHSPVKNFKNDLIDKFIKENPIIASTNKDESFNIVNLAQESLADNDEIVSETLARIYINQDNIPRAIKIYEKLILLFPEKSAYFASQIEKLKK